jgi:MFS transporter, FHS family, glucose/mannose:H+ symporter
MTAAISRSTRPGAVTLLAVHLMLLPTGAIQALYGPSLPAVAQRFGLDSGTAGLLIGANGVGAFLGILAWVILQRRLGLGRFAALAGVALGIGCLLLAAAGTWPLTVMGAVLAGFGFGGNASGLNVYVSRLLGDRSAPLLVSMAAVFGLGSILAPALLGVVGLAAHRAVFAAVGVTALIAAPLLLCSAHVSPAPTTPRGSRRPSRVAVLFMAAIALYVALEASIGGWAATHLIAEGYQPEVAARWTAAFWTTFTLGRFLAAPLALRVPPRTMATASLGLGAVALALATTGTFAVAGYVLAGAALAPAFPAIYAWYAKVTGTSGLASAQFFLAGTLGAALGTPLIGVLAQATTARAIPYSLAVVAVAGTWMLQRLRMRTRA